MFPNHKTAYTCTHILKMQSCVHICMYVFVCIRYACVYMYVNMATTVKSLFKLFYLCNSIHPCHFKDIEK